MSIKKEDDKQDSLEPSYYFKLIHLQDVIATRVKENDEIVLQNELRSLGIDCKRRNEFNDKSELQAHANAIKEVYFQDYKTAYAPKEDDRNDYDPKDLK